MKLVERLVDDARIVLVQPIPKLCIGDEYSHGIAGLEQEPGRPEPGVEAVPIDLGLDLMEDFFPEVHGLSDSKTNK